MIRSGGACVVPRPKRTLVLRLRTICANLSTVPMSNDGISRYTSSSMVQTGKREPLWANSQLEGSEVHSTIDSFGVNFQLSRELQHGHNVNCSGVLGSPGGRRKASWSVGGVAPAPTQRPTPIGDRPRL